MNKRYLKRENENIIDYEIRLANIKKKEHPKDLNWDDIKQLVGFNGNENTLRKANDSIFGGINIAKYYEKKNAKKYDKCIMFINDLHCPFERSDVLDIIEKHSNEITDLVIGGDFLDCQSISHFPKIKELFLKDEVIYGYNLLKNIRKILNNKQNIIFTLGNHENRYYHNICDMQQKDLQLFINPNIIEMYTEGFKMYVNKKKIIYDPIPGVKYIPHWYALINNILVCHPLNFSQCNGKMAENISSWTINNKLNPYLIIMAHTHKFSMSITERFGGLSVVENGCMCKSQDYADIGKTSYSPQSYAYSIVRFNHGEKINLNNVQTYHLEPEKNEISNYLNFSIDL